MNANTPFATKAKVFLDMLLAEDLETLAQELAIKTNERTVSLVEDRLLELHQHIQACKRASRAMAETTTGTRPMPKPLTGRLVAEGDAEDATTTVAAAPLPYNRWKHSDGIVRRVPQYWTFPLCTLDRAYVWWHCGDPTHKIGPLKETRTADFHHVHRGDKNFAELRNVMKVIDEFIQKQGLTQHGWSHDHMDPSQALAVFQKFQTLHEQGKGAFSWPDLPSGRPRRPLDQLKWASVVAILSKAKRLRACSLSSDPPSSSSSCASNNNKRRVRIEHETVIGNGAVPPRRLPFQPSSVKQSKKRKEASSLKPSQSVALQLSQRQERLSQSLLSSKSPSSSNPSCLEPVDGVQFPAAGRLFCDSGEETCSE